MMRFLLGFFLLFLLTLSHFEVKAQPSPSNCTIEVATKITEPTTGLSNGKVEFIFGKSTKNYTIYLINRKPEDSKKPIKESEVNNLKAGFYDFLIVDDVGCNKQLTVILTGK